MITRRTAEFSRCGKFRHQILQRWDAAKPWAVWQLANPSVASDLRPDPTWTKVVGFSERLGYGGAVVVNVFDFIATYPRDLKAAGYPRSMANDAWILHAALALGNGRIICGWGAVLRGRPEPMAGVKMLRDAGVQTYAFGFTDRGEPRHPLMLPYSTPLEAWNG